MLRVLLPGITAVLFLLAAPAGPITRIDWSDDILTLLAPEIPGAKVETRYLEAFCRTGSTDREWSETVIPHTTKILDADPDGQHLKLETVVEPDIRIVHDIRIVENGVAFSLNMKNESSAFVDVDWAQPCMRVGGFTGLQQEDYFTRCFIFTEAGQMMLDKLPRTEDARYRGGQVYVPKGINLDDVNPRPISTVAPRNHLIGCISSDDRWVLATAWDKTQELFQGVITCIHADPRIGGLNAGEEKHLEGRVYLLPNDMSALLDAYAQDFEK